MSDGPSAEKDVGCYICQPDNPDAAEEGCGSCDRDYWSFVARVAEANACQRRPHYPGETCECEERLSLVVTHTKTSTDRGPDFCAECSEAIAEWVPWPCDQSTRVLPPASGSA
jgi:hypothetical protein